MLSTSSQVHHILVSLWFITFLKKACRKAKPNLKLISMIKRTISLDRRTRIRGHKCYSSTKSNLKKIKAVPFPSQSQWGVWTWQRRKLQMIGAFLHPQHQQIVMLPNLLPLERNASFLCPLKRSRYVLRIKTEAKKHVAGNNFSFLNISSIQGAVQVNGMKIFSFWVILIFFVQLYVMWEWWLTATKFY